MSTGLIDGVMDYLSNCDHLIEYGTSGDWKYRKWESGRYVCWCTASKSNVSFTAWGSLYYADWTSLKAFPITFTSAPIVFITPRGSQAYVIGSWGTTTTNVGTVRFGHNGTSAVAIECAILAFGKWK